MIQNNEYFTILGILELFTRKVCIFLQNFKRILMFLYVCKQTFCKLFTILRIKNTKFSEYYINLNSTIQEDFQICISVYLQIFLSKKQVSWSIKSIHSTTFFPVIQKQKGAFLILIWVGFLGVHFEVYVCMRSTFGGGELPSLSKTC